MPRNFLRMTQITKIKHFFYQFTSFIIYHKIDFKDDKTRWETIEVQNGGHRMISHLHSKVLSTNFKPVNIVDLTYFQ